MIPWWSSNTPMRLSWCQLPVLPDWMPQIPETRSPAHIFPHTLIVIIETVSIVSMTKEWLKQSVEILLHNFRRQRDMSHAYGFAYLSFVVSGRLSLQQTLFYYNDYLHQGSKIGQEQNFEKCKYSSKLQSRSVSQTEHECGALSILFLLAVRAKVNIDYRTPSI